MENVGWLSLTSAIFIITVASVSAALNPSVTPITNTYLVVLSRSRLFATKISPDDDTSEKSWAVLPVFNWKFRLLALPISFSCKTDVDIKVLSGIVIS